MHHEWVTEFSLAKYRKQLQCWMRSASVSLHSEPGRMPLSYQTLVFCSCSQAIWWLNLPGEYVSSGIKVGRNSFCLDNGGASEPHKSSRLPSVQLISFVIISRNIVTIVEKLMKDRLELFFLLRHRLNDQATFLRYSVISAAGNGLLKK